MELCPDFLQDVGSNAANGGKLFARCARRMLPMFPLLSSPALQLRAARVLHHGGNLGICDLLKKDLRDIQVVPAELGRGSLIAVKIQRDSRNAVSVLLEVNSELSFTTLWTKGSKPFTLYALIGYRFVIT